MASRRLFGDDFCSDVVTIDPFYLVRCHPAELIHADDDESIKVSANIEDLLREGVLPGLVARVGTRLLGFFCNFRIQSDNCFGLSLRHQSQSLGGIRPCKFQQPAS